MKLLHEDDRIKVELDDGNVYVTTKTFKPDTDPVNVKVFPYMDTLCVSSSGDMMISDWNGTTGVQCLPHE